jgi:hypothetical protein
MEELGKEYSDHVRQMHEQCSLDGEAVVFHIADDYRILLSRCDTAEKLLGWIVHLTEKKWMTVPLLRHFIRLVSEHHGIDVHAAS